MNKLIITLFAVLAIAQAQTSLCSNAEKFSKILCTSESAQPVCGIKQGSNGKADRQTYQSRCRACQDLSVTFLAEGVCEMYPQEGTFCHPNSFQNKVCTREFVPVCGMVGPSFLLCQGGPCVQSFSNSCSACSNGSYFHVPGNCQQQHLIQ